jgi:uncharacterized protein YdeI (YjbR/CyaY-like superfamily)
MASFRGRSQGARETPRIKRRSRVRARRCATQELVRHGTQEVAMNPKVDAFLKRQDKWRAEFEMLRGILLDSGLTEELKWGQPCYALDGKNVALIHGFKEYCAILFHKGALLQDTKSVLIQQTKNVQAARQIRFASIQEVTKLKKTVKAYVREAIEIERAGLKVQFKKTEDLKLPEEFESKLAVNAKLRAAFAALTPGRQRAYIFHFSQPKLSTTRAARMEKHIPRILEGLGLDD